MSILPKGYKRLEYIESDGLQYIDTGVGIDAYTKVCVEAALLPNTVDCWLFGARRTRNYYLNGVSASDYRITYADFGISIPRPSIVYGWLGYTESEVANVHECNQVEINHELYNSGESILTKRCKYTVGTNSVVVQFPDGTEQTIMQDATTPNYPDELKLCLFNLRIQSYEGVVKHSNIGAQARLYGCEVFHEDTDNTYLSHNLVPCLNENDVAGLYDTVTGKFHCNDGRGKFNTSAVLWEVSENFEKITLPSGYTQVEYIETFGEQAIDTCYYPNENTKVVMDVSVARGTSSKWLCGTRNYSSKETFGALIRNSGIDDPFAGIGINYNPDEMIIHDVDHLWPRVQVAIEANQCKILYPNGKETVIDDCSTISGQMEYPLSLFTINVAGTLSSTARCSAKLYSCQIYEGDELIHNYIPCINSDNVTVLYDIAVGSETLMNSIVEFNDEFDTIGTSYPSELNDLKLVGNSLYRVVFDDVEYYCASYKYSTDVGYVIALGNGQLDQLYGITTNHIGDEPFLIISDPSGTYSIIYSDAVVYGNVDVIISPVFEYANCLTNIENQICELPAGYTRLEYIESDGSQYIITDACPISSTRVVIDVEWATSGNYAGRWLFGSRLSNIGVKNAFGVLLSSASEIYSQYGILNPKIKMSDIESVVTNLITNRTVIDKNANTIEIAWVDDQYGNCSCSYTHATQDIDSFTPIALFGARWTGQDENGNIVCTEDKRAIMKLYACQIYNARSRYDSSIHDFKFIPCVENSTGRMGLYCIVSDTTDSREPALCCNEGSGMFIATQDPNVLHKGFAHEERQRPVTKKTTIVDGIEKQIKKIYVGDENGTAKLIFFDPTI